MQILRLTRHNRDKYFGPEIWINFDLVQCLFRAKSKYPLPGPDCTRICFGTVESNEDYLDVIETLEQIGVML